MKRIYLAALALCMLGLKLNANSCCCGKFFIYGEGLYWKTTQGGMDYADTFNSNAGALGDATEHEVDFHWHAGFRVGAGYESNCNWDITGSYTYFNPTESTSEKGTVFPNFYFQGSSSLPAVTLGEIKWDLCFQAADIEFGYHLSNNDCFDFRPYIGVKGAWIDQNVDVRYANVSNTALIRVDNDYWGVGPKMGFFSLYRFCPCFFAFGNVSGALLAGKFDTHQKQTLNGSTTVDLKSDFYRVNPTVQGYFGLGYESDFCLCECPFGLALWAGYEVQYWWRQDQMARFTVGGSGDSPVHLRNASDLGFYGLTAGGMIKF